MATTSLSVKIQAYDFATLLKLSSRLETRDFFHSTHPFSQKVVFEVGVISLKEGESLDSSECRECDEKRHERAGGGREDLIPEPI